MLTPEYLSRATRELEALFVDLETNILIDIAERIRDNNYSLSTTARYELSLLNRHSYEVTKKISDTLNISQEKVSKIITNSSYKSLATDNLIFKQAYKQGLIPAFNFQKENFRDLINKGIVALNNEISNITNTTLKKSQSTLINSINRAYLEAQSGLYTTEQAIAKAINDLGKNGLGLAEYTSGTQRQMDTAIRTATRTAINQTALKVQEKNADEFDCNLVETTAHYGARPDHAEWQGKVFWRNYQYKKYGNFEIETGYGTGAGLGGWNCRHGFYPFFEGLSTEAYPKPLDLEKNERWFELEQEQRYNERMIRAWKRRATVNEAGGIDNSNELGKVREWKSRQKLFVDRHEELKRSYDLEKI